MFHCWICHVCLIISLWAEFCLISINVGELINEWLLLWRRSINLKVGQNRCSNVFRQQSECKVSKNSHFKIQPFLEAYLKLIWTFIFLPSLITRERNASILVKRNWNVQFSQSHLLLQYTRFSPTLSSKKRFFYQKPCQKKVKVLFINDLLFILI